MSNQMLKVLENQIKQLEVDIPSFERILEFTKKEAEKIYKFSETYYLVQELEEKIRKMKTEKQVNELKLNKLLAASGNKKVQAMFFKAGHRRFDSDEVTKLALNLRKFKEEPIEQHFDAGMSDDAKLFVSEKVSDEEAQMMWEVFWNNLYGEDDNEIMRLGDLLTWNGKTYIDSIGNSIIK